MTRRSALTGWLAASALGLAVCGSGCGGGSSTPATRNEDTSSPSASAVPYPELARFDEQVQRQLREARNEFDRQLEEGAAGPGLAEAYGEMGRLYHAYDLVDEAEACYQRAQELAPGEFAWPYYRAHLALARGDLDAAKARFAQVLALSPGDVPTLIHLGRVQLELDRLDEAATAFERAHQLDPGSPAALTGLGRVELGREAHGEAATYLEQALNLSPDDRDARYQLGLAYRGLGQRERALELLSREGTPGRGFPDPLLDALKDLMAGWRVHYQRGTAYFEQGLPEPAIEELRRAAEIAPGEPTVHASLGAALALVGDTEGALRELRLAVRLDPEPAVPRFNLGSLLAEGGDDLEAVQHYRAALESNPELLGAHLNMANALRRLGEFNASLPHYRRVVDNDPRNEGARVGEALALVRLQRYEEAVRKLETAVEALPESRLARYVLAVLLASAPVDGLRDGTRALDLARTLIEEDPSIYHVTAMAMAAAELGEYGTAAEWQERAVEAARGAERPDLLPALEENLALYRAGRPCRTPWKDDDPLLAPPPLGG